MATDKVNSRCDWSFDINCDEFMCKQDIVKLYVTKILRITQKIFKYNNLPKTIPQKDLELLLQCNGSATITKVGDDLYAFRGGLGGVPNAYYLPTISVVANPYLKFNAQLEIDKDCVVMLNDSLYQGMLPLIRHNSYLLAECDISFKFATINNRIPAIISAPNDTAYKSALEFFKQIEEGEHLGVIGDEEFFEKLSVYNYANSSTLVQHLIELKQYIMGTFYQELGIQSQFNMKREAINESEASLNTDILYPTIDDMLEQRQLALDKINAMYGTNISVELSSIWKQLRETQDLSLNLIESEINKNNSGSTEPNNEGGEPNNET